MDPKPSKPIRSPRSIETSVAMRLMPAECGELERIAGEEIRLSAAMARTTFLRGLAHYRQDSASA